MLTRRSIEYMGTKEANLLNPEILPFVDLLLVGKAVMYDRKAGMRLLCIRDVYREYKVR